MFSYDNESVKERVCDFRKFSKVTQSEMAEYLGMKRTAYQHHEADGNFTWEQIELLADFFSTSPIFLRYGADDDDLRSLSKMLKSGKATAFKQPTFTIFDDVNRKVEELSDYTLFLCMDEIHRNRITKYIIDNDL